MYINGYLECPLLDQAIWLVEMVWSHLSMKWGPVPVRTNKRYYVCNPIHTPKPHPVTFPNLYCSHSQTFSNFNFFHRSSMAGIVISIVPHLLIHLYSNFHILRRHSLFYIVMSRNVHECVKYVYNYVYLSCWDHNVIVKLYMITVKVCIHVYTSTYIHLHIYNYIYIFI